jgi:four helix bundle protein
VIPPHAFEETSVDGIDAESLRSQLYCWRVSDFKDLKVWRKSHALALNVHRTTTGIRGRDSVALRSQMLRAAMSIPANIVEGCGQQTTRQFVRFLQISLGSTSDLEYHLLVARDTAVITKSDFESLRAQMVEIRRMLYALVRKLSDVKSGVVGKPVVTS